MRMDVAELPTQQHQIEVEHKLADYKMPTKLGEQLPQSFFI